MLKTKQNLFVGILAFLGIIVGISLCSQFIAQTLINKKSFNTSSTNTVAQFEPSVMDINVKLRFPDISNYEKLRNTYVSGVINYDGLTEVLRELRKAAGVENRAFSATFADWGQWGNIKVKETFEDMSIIALMAKLLKDNDIVCFYDETGNDFQFVDLHEAQHMPSFLNVLDFNSLQGPP